MVTEPRTLDQSDPLNAFAGISLLPRPFRAPFEASMASQPNDLESIHQVAKFVGLTNAGILLEESKAIVDNGSEQLLNSNYPSFKSNLGLDDHVAEKLEHDKPRERRPGLGRKRPRFSMKPVASQTIINLGTSLDVNQIEDPEEYFLACEKLENAKQEVNRQLGIVDKDSNINNLPTNARRPRPVISGKSARSVRYKHRFSSVPFDNNDTVMSSQETQEQDDLCALNVDLQKENNGHDAELQESELTGLITEQENRVNEVLDKLLSCDTKDLDGDGVFSLLQEQLQMKSPKISALRLPDFPTIRTGYVTVGERIQKATKSVLGLQNTGKRTSGEGQREDIPQSDLSSPTPPKSPFSSLTLLKKQLLKSNLLRDPFSPQNVDLNDTGKNSNQDDHVKELSNPDKLPGEFNIKGMNDLDTIHSDHQACRSAETNVQSVNRDISHHESHAQMGDHGGHIDGDHMAMKGTELLNDQSLEKNSGGETETVVRQSESHGSHTDGDHMAMKGTEHLNDQCDHGGHTDGDHMAMKGTEHLNDQSLEKNSGGVTETVVGQSEYHGSMEQCNGWNDVDIGSDDEHSGMQNRDTDIDGKNKMQDAHTHMQALSPAQVQVEYDDTTNISNETETDIQNNLSCQMNEHAEDMASEFPAEQDHNANDVYISENCSGNQNSSNQSKSAAAQGDPMDMQSALPEINPRQHIMKRPTKKQTRKSSPGRLNRERKSLKFRPSFADAGTLIENGVRRSKRIRSRPLEFWKGERLLFGRINESIKLIGVKYVSPLVGNMKVESYISDEYKEIVDSAARY